MFYMFCFSISFNLILQLTAKLRNPYYLTFSSIKSVENANTRKYNDVENSSLHGVGVKHMKILTTVQLI